MQLYASIQHTKRITPNYLLPSHNLFSSSSQTLFSIIHPILMHNATWPPTCHPNHSTDITNQHLFHLLITPQQLDQYYHSTYFTNNPSSQLLILQLSCKYKKKIKNHPMNIYYFKTYKYLQFSCKYLIF